VITEKKNNTLTAQIQHLGAELISLKIESRERIHLGGNLNFGKTFSSFISIVGTLKNNTFHHNEKNYHLSRHGFARE
jgi:galactose mutarotase-like enzyme